jgi:NAD(P)-dependent dehydrogenase (short-subunit alcohol dehydrogenase family)
MNGVVVITGGSRGIGRATALAAAARGYRVCIGYVANEAAADEVTGAIEAGGGKAISVRCDVGVESDVVALFERANDLGPLRALVNNAGVVDLIARVEEMTNDRLQRMMTINVVGCFLCAREAVRRMSTRHGGQGGAIVSLSSAQARLGASGAYVDYAASKAAVETMTLGLAREVAADGIRVNAVRAGVVDTEIHASSGAPDRVAQFMHTIPLQRLGTAEEVAKPIVWLMSDEASYVTGAILDVTGGR